MNFRHLLPALLLPAVLGLAPASALAADPMQGVMAQKAEMDQAQREKLLQTAKNLEGNPAAAGAGGMGAQTASRPPGAQFNTPAEAKAQPAQKPGAGPKSTTPIYGDIIIHK